jgi:hypothetical protein
MPEAYLRAVVELGTSEVFPVVTALVSNVPPYGIDTISFFIESGQSKTISLADLLSPDSEIRQNAQRCLSSGICRELHIPPAAENVVDKFRLLKTRHVVAHYFPTWIGMFQICPPHSDLLADGARQVFLTYLDNLRQRRLLAEWLEMFDFLPLSRLFTEFHGDNEMRFVHFPHIEQDGFFSQAVKFNNLTGRHFYLDPETEDPLQADTELEAERRLGARIVPDLHELYVWANDGSPQIMALQDQVAALQNDLAQIQNEQILQQVEAQDGSNIAGSVDPSSGSNSRKRTFDEI